MPVYECLAHEGCWYIVSRFIDGGDLRQRITPNNRNHEESAKIVRYVAEALSFAHMNGIIHRDIKPANILLDKEGKPHVTDFGAALREEAFGRDPGQATIWYMSPEQARKRGHVVDGRSDIYSLGVVFYELLTGRSPYRAKTFQALIEEIRLPEELRPPRQLDPTVPEELERICLKAVRKEADKRYSTANAMADDLQRWEPTLAFQRAQKPTAEQLRRQEAEMEDLRLQQAKADRRRRELGPERVVGPVPDALVDHFKDRIHQLRSLRDQLTDQNLRLVFVCGRGGMGKTSLITKLVHELRSTHLQLEGATGTCEFHSIVYIPLRQQEFRSPDRIVELIYRVLDAEAADALRTKWQQKTSLEDKLEFLFRRILARQPCLMLLDNFEDLLDNDNFIRSEYADLRQLVEMCLQYDHGVRIAATSRRALILPPELQAIYVARQAELVLHEGLSEADAVALLRDLDTDGRLGIRDAPEATLREIARRCCGIPRTLQTVVGTLASRRTSNLVRLLDDKLTVARLIENPSRELYDSLSADERLVMQALAVYDAPVPIAAVRYVLPALAVEDILDAFVRNYVVTYDRERVSLGALEQNYAYRQIPDGDGEYSKCSLHRQAAGFYRQVRKPPEEWRSLEDLDPQRREFDQLVCACLHDDAFKVLDEIDFDYLSLWGHSALMVELHSRLTGHLTTLDSQRTNLNSLGIGHRTLGGVAQAIAFYEKASAIGEGVIGDRENGPLLNNLGYAYTLVGKLAKAKDCCERALKAATAAFDNKAAAVRSLNLGLVYSALGETEPAIDCFDRAITFSKQADYPRARVASLDNFGWLYLQAGQFDRAIEYFQRTVELATELDERENRCHALLGLGTCYHHQGHLSRAKSNYEQALELQFQFYNYVVAIKIAVLILEQGDKKKTDEYFEAGVASCRVLLAKTPRLCDALYHLALAQLAGGQSRESLAMYRQALEVCSANGIMRGARLDLGLLERLPEQVPGLNEAITLLEPAQN